MAQLHIVQTWINLVCTDLLVLATPIAGGHVQPLTRSACAYFNNVGFRQGCTSIPVTASTLHALCLYGVKHRLAGLYFFLNELFVPTVHGGLQPWLPPGCLQLAPVPSPRCLLDPSSP